MAATSGPRVSQISCPVPSSVAIVHEADRQVLDAQVGEIALEQPLQPVAADQAGPADVEIEQAHDAALGERACEGFELVELAGGVAAADDGADRTARDDIRHDAFAFEDPHDADMGPAPGCAAAKRKADLQRVVFGARTAGGLDRFVKSCTRQALRRDGRCRPTTWRETSRTAADHRTRR